MNTCRFIPDILPIFLVGFGTLIMICNIYKYFSFAKQMSYIHTKAKHFLKVILFAYIILLIFFLIGYAVIGVCLFDPTQEISHVLVGCIFFFGSIFVLIGLILQRSLCWTVQRSNLEITQALIASVEARDTNLNGHSLHVARLTKLIYKYLPKERQKRMNPEDLEYAALLHDIGKLGVPEYILNKAGALNDEEWAEIRKHPQIGKNILSELESFEEIGTWVLYHHERCDGKGYMGLTEDQIPFPSKLIAVADTFSAITMKRSYHNEKNYAHASAILLECAGTQLSKELVDIFLSIPEEEVAHCMPNKNELTHAGGQ